MKNPTTDAELDALLTSHFAATPDEPLMLFSLPEALYRAARGENISALKFIAESPKKYRYARENPQPVTPAMQAGTVIHALTLCPILGEGEAYVTRPAQWDSFRSKPAREWRDAQTLPIVDAESLAECQEISRSIATHPKAGWILSRAQKEVAVWKRHERTGLILKGRLDLPFLDLEQKTAVADIKTCQSVKPSLFSTAIGERLYHAAGAFYCDLIGAGSFYFIAVEKDAPYEVDIFRLSDRSMQQGRTLYEALLDRLVKCREENRWPGVSEDTDEIRDIDAPAWAYTAETIAA